VRISCILLIIVAGEIAIGCGDPVANDSTRVESVTVVPESVSLELGDVSQATAVVRNSSGASVMEAVEWTSRDLAVVTATAGSQVTSLTARNLGETWVVATASERSDSVRVTVTPTGPPATHEGWQVTPAGSWAGQGTATSPWSLDYALDGAEGRVQRGDTVWLRGGIYPGTFNATLCGTPSEPIIVRQYPGERATIQGTLTIEGCDTWYWDFEVANTNHGSQDIMGVNDHGPRTKLINLVVHDHSGNGIGLWAEAPDAEAYGNILYNNGFCGSEGVPPNCTSFGHGIYSQNAIGAKLLRDNIVFQSFGYGFHLYAESQFLRDFTVEGNAIFNNAMMTGSNVLVGGEPPVERLTFTRNMTYQSAGFGNGAAWFGRGGTNGPATVTDNYLVGGDPSLRLFGWGSFTSTNNTIVRGDGILMEQSGSWGGMRFTGSTWYGTPGQIEVLSGSTDWTFAQWKANIGATDAEVSGKPTEQKVFVRPNAYEPGRANVIVYNWSGAGSVSVDLSGVLAPGQFYEVRNVQRIWDAPVLSGTYSGGSISVPIQAVSAYTPFVVPQDPPPPGTGTQFSVFLVTSR
jgi:hypothetical protein